jgi:plasmid stabilization system protein ParE
VSALEYAPRVSEDFKRIVEFHENYTAQDGVRRIEDILRALEVLTSSPYIGRPVSGGRRELVIGDKQGFVALYTVNETDRVVLVLRLRAQREEHYPDPQD